MWAKIKSQFINLFEKTDQKAVYTILWMTLVITLYFYFGIQDFFVKVAGSHFSSQSELLYYQYIYHNFMAFFFFFILSIPFVKLVLKQDLKDTGLIFKEKKISLGIMIAAVIITPVVSLGAVFDKEMASLYPLGGEMIFAGVGFFILYYFSYIAYYFGWEYLFRGLGFFNINKRYGPAMAIAITTMISALIHSSIAGFGKPFSETFSAIVGGLILGFITYKSKSIYPALCVHFLLGFTLDILIKLLA